MVTADAGQATVRVTVDVALGSSPISGVVHADSGVDREFVGWTALASEIDAALTGAARPAASSRPAVPEGPEWHETQLEPLEVRAE